jgi:type II secretory ATPase GspE/PulE/Tfp pilus assembly ATPase PilB-like protein
VTIDGKFKGLDSTVERRQLPVSLPIKKRTLMTLEPLVTPGLIALITEALAANATNIDFLIDGQQVTAVFAIDGNRNRHEGLSNEAAQSIVDEIHRSVLGEDAAYPQGLASAVFELSCDGFGLVRVRLATAPMNHGAMIFMRLLRMHPSSTPVRVEDLSYSTAQLATLKGHQSASDVVMAGEIGSISIPK